jgi:hypothetical protein
VLAAERADVLVLVLVRQRNRLLVFLLLVPGLGEGLLLTNELSLFLFLPQGLELELLDSKVYV